jgi:outer membrane biosynthesis protein TonB
MKKKVGGFFQTQPNALPDMQLCKAMVENPAEYGLPDDMFTRSGITLDKDAITVLANDRLPVLTNFSQSGGKYKKKETKKPKKETKKPKKETKKPKKETKKPKKETKKPKKETKKPKKKTKKPKKKL